MTKLIERQIQVVQKLQEWALAHPDDASAVGSLGSAVLDLIRLRESA